MRTHLLILAPLLLAACPNPKAPQEPTTRPATRQPASAPSARPAAQEPLPASIGSATMKDDGTIVMQLRAEGPGGIRGDALFTYKKGHKQYDEIIKHLGGLEPGQTKPVPPWPDK